MRVLSDNASLLWVLRRFRPNDPITLVSFSLEYSRCASLKEASINGSVTRVVARACENGFLKKAWRVFEHVYTITVTGMEKRTELENLREVVAELAEGK